MIDIAGFIASECAYTLGRLAVATKEARNAQTVAEGQLWGEVATQLQAHGTALSTLLCKVLDGDAAPYPFTNSLLRAGQPLDGTQDD